MEDRKLQSLLESAQNGDDKSREKILTHFKSFILSVSSKVSKRYLTWSDDETSIGLFAMNKAIDHFNNKHGKSFLNFSYMLITREIIDFFRKENRHQNVSFDEDMTYEDEGIMEETIYEREVAQREYELRTEHEALIDEILIYEAELSHYDLTFEELPDLSPKHRDTRDNCFYLADVMINNASLLSQMKRRKRLPITALAKVAGVSPRTIENHRKYILAVTLLLLQPDLQRLKAYIKRQEDTVDE